MHPSKLRVRPTRINKYQRYFLLREDAAQSYQANGKNKNPDSVSRKGVDPKEKIRLKYYFDLLETYKYSFKRVEFDREARVEGVPVLADIVVFADDKKTRPFIVVECSPKGSSNIIFNNALRQAILKARFLKASYAVCLTDTKKRIVMMRLGEDKDAVYVPAQDIPMASEEKSQTAVTNS